jgi:hypothetical protein
VLNLLRAIVPMFSGGVFAIIGVLLWRHAARAADSFRKAGSMLFGDKTAETVYTAWNLKWGAGGAVVVGAIMFISGLVATIRLF